MPCLCKGEAIYSLKRLFSCLLQAVLPVELINAAAGVYQLLLAGVERVTLGADLNGDVLLGGAGLDHIAAGAANGRRLVVRVNALLHGFVSPQSRLP